MIARYTIKFAPAVSQKELEKKLVDGDLMPEEMKKIHLLKIKLEIVGDVSDLMQILIS